MTHEAPEGVTFGHYESKDGVRMTGVVEHVEGIAWLSDDVPSLVRDDKTGAIEIDGYIGDTRMIWDSQVPIIEDGHRVFHGADGNSYPEDQLVFVPAGTEEPDVDEDQRLADLQITLEEGIAAFLFDRDRDGFNEQDAADAGRHIFRSIVRGLSVQQLKQLRERFDVEEPQ